MNYISGMILGLVQGLTEFLPVSSSGHLVIFEHFLKINTNGVLYELLLHLGTTLSVIVIFYKRIIQIAKSFFTFKKDEDYYLAWNIIVANIPVGLIGVLGYDNVFEKLFSFNIVMFTLILNGIVLILTKFVKAGNKPLTLLKSIFIGIFQCFAITPGISRSGSTIFAALLGKVSPLKAFEFSFLLSLPVIIGATLKKFLEYKGSVCLQAPHYLGFLIAFISGIFALKFLKKTVVKGKLYYFGVYCLLLGIFFLIKK